MARSRTTKSQNKKQNDNEKSQSNSAAAAKKKKVGCRSRKKSLKEKSVNVSKGNKSRVSQNVSIYEYNNDLDEALLSDPKDITRMSLNNSAVENAPKIDEPAPVNKKRKSQPSTSRANSCSNAIEINIENSESDTEAAPPKKKVMRKSTNKIPKPRKKNAEQQKTLDILVEKFQRDTIDSAKGKCLIEGCRSNALSWKPSNLKRHLLQMHQPVYKQLFVEEIDKEKAARIELLNTVLDAVTMVTIDGLPFAALNSAGVKGFVSARLNALGKLGYKISINRKNILFEIEKVSYAIENRISAEMAGKLVCVYFDICTKGTLSVLGVNATYDADDETVCRSLGIYQIDVRHNAVNLANMNFDILSKFNVQLLQVFAMVSDNARNAVNTAEVLDFVANSANECDDSKEDDIYYDGDVDDDIIGEENDVELRKIINNAHKFDQLLDDLGNEIRSTNNKIVLINHINCGTHTLQLAVNDAIRDSNIESIFAKAKDLCNDMRSQVVMIEYRKLNGHKKLPPMDNATRWNSRFIMVKQNVYLFFFTNFLCLPIFLLNRFVNLEKSDMSSMHCH